MRILHVAAVSVHINILSIPLPLRSVHPTLYCTKHNEVPYPIGDSARHSKWWYLSFVCDTKHLNNRHEAKKYKTRYIYIFGFLYRSLIKTTNTATINNISIALIEIIWSKSFYFYHGWYNFNLWLTTENVPFIFQLVNNGERNITLTPNG
jgi:hypothetical protein